MTWRFVLATSGTTTHYKIVPLTHVNVLCRRRVARLREAFQIDVSRRSVFDIPTVAGVAAMILASRRGVAPE